MDLVSEYIQENRAGGRIAAVITSMKLSKKMTMKDGFTMSVQASAGHYCSPKYNDGPWESVEVGFTSSWQKLLKPYAEGRPYTQTVYGWVPVEIVEAIIKKHGGLA